MFIDAESERLQRRLEASEHHGRQLQEWLEASVAWMEHAISICQDRRIPAADHLAEGRAIIESARNRLAHGQS